MYGQTKPRVCDEVHVVGSFPEPKRAPPAQKHLIGLDPQ